ncbi:hypothetical protein [Flavobacterium caeni]|uniref:Uncharacterized protein n=1 Tax=Flavobacterium caeni TaxID=490189 RepID=A0A1G5J6G2_9FLAO|nr:hypothetical protein [Flavobacterium caeni]SCY83965.1 hypothetical protein SAMN02927903_02572 [Flavobacterium caeni]
MLRYMIALSLLITLTSFRAETQVFICGPAGAKKYHYTANCRGLSACKHGTFEVPKSKAESLGLSLCGWED